MGEDFALLNLDTRWPWSSPLEGEVVSSLLPRDCPPIGDAAEVGGRRPPVWDIGGPQGPPV